MNTKNSKHLLALSPLLLIVTLISLLFFFINSHYSLEPLFLSPSQSKAHYSLPKRFLPFKHYNLWVLLYSPKNKKECQYWKNISQKNDLILLCIENTSQQHTPPPLLQYPQIVDNYLNVIKKNYKISKTSIIGFGKEGGLALKIGLNADQAFQNILSFYPPKSFSPSLLISAHNQQKVLLIGNQSYFSKKHSKVIYKALKTSKRNVRLWLYPYNKVQLPSSFNKEFRKILHWFNKNLIVNRQDIIDLI